MLYCLYMHPLLLYAYNKKRFLKKIILINQWRKEKSFSVYSVVQLFIWFRKFVHSVFRLFVFTRERSVDRLIFNSVIRLSVCFSGYSFARSSACAFVCIFGLLFVPPFAQFFLLFMGINMLKQLSLTD